MRKRRVPECGHADRTHYGKGMCRACYRKKCEIVRTKPDPSYVATKQREKRARAMAGTGPLMCIHKDHEHYKAGFCEECYKERQKAKIGHYNSSEGQNHYLKKTYGITQQEYIDMCAEQDGKCLICGRCGAYGTGVSKGDRLHIDHDHSTGAIRGLLCNDCNRGLGCFMDDPGLLTKAAEYLRDSNKKGG